MITAGSVRGNWGLLARRAPQLVAGRPRLQVAAAARTEPGGEVPLGHAHRMQDQRSLVAFPGERQEHGADAPPTRPSTRAPTRDRRSRRSAPGRPAPPGAPESPGGASSGEIQSTCPSTAGCNLEPASTSTRVSGSAQRASSQASSVRNMPCRLWACAESATCGKVRSELVTSMRLLARRRGNFPCREHPHRRPAGRHRPHRPDARRPPAGEVDRRDLPRRRQVLQRGPRDARLHRHLARGAGLGAGLRDGPAVHRDLRQRAVHRLRRAVGHQGRIVRLASPRRSPSATSSSPRAPAPTPR